MGDAIPFQHRCSRDRRREAAGSEGAEGEGQDLAKSDGKRSRYDRPSAKGRDPAEEWMDSWEMAPGPPKDSGVSSGIWWMRRRECSGGNGVRQQRRWKLEAGSWKLEAGRCPRKMGGGAEWTWAGGWPSGR